MRPMFLVFITTMTFHSLNFCSDSDTGLLTQPINVDKANILAGMVLAYAIMEKQNTEKEILRYKREAALQQELQQTKALILAREKAITITQTKLANLEARFLADKKTTNALRQQLVDALEKNSLRDATVAALQQESEQLKKQNKELLDRFGKEKELWDFFIKKAEEFDYLIKQKKEFDKLISGLKDAARTARNRRVLFTVDSADSLSDDDNDDESDASDTTSDGGATPPDQDISVTRVPVRNRILRRITFNHHPNSTTDGTITLS